MNRGRYAANEVGGSHVADLETPHEDGYTLMELLITIAIMGITFSVLLGGIATSFIAGGIHQKTVTVQALIRGYAEAIENATYVTCATTDPADPDLQDGDYKSAIDAADVVLPAGYSWNWVGAMGYWNGDTPATFRASCGGNDQGLQRMRLRVSSNGTAPSEDTTTILKSENSGPVTTTTTTIPPTTTTTVPATTTTTIPPVPCGPVPAAPPSGAPANEVSSIFYLSGFEAGIAPLAGGFPSNPIQGYGVSFPDTDWTNGGPRDIDASARRSGNYSIKLTKNDVWRTNFRKEVPTPGSTIVTRLAFCFQSLPSSDFNIASINADVKRQNGLAPDVIRDGSAQLFYETGSNKLYMQYVGGSWVYGTTISANTWYLLDMRANLGAANHVVDWRINGMAQPSLSENLGISNTAVEIMFGAINDTSSGFAINYDDIIATTDSDEYPIGDGRIFGMMPNAAGTHSGSSRFWNNGGTAIDGTSAGRLDDLPMNSTTEFVEQRTNGASSYLEFQLSDTTGSWNSINGVAGIAWMQGIGAPDVSTRVRDGGNETEIPRGASDTTEVISGIVNASGGSWTTAEVNALVFRFGYNSNDDDMRWYDVMAEFDAKP